MSNNPNKTNDPETIKTVSEEDFTMFSPSSPENELVEHPPSRPLLGIVFAIISSLMLCFMNLFAKLCDVLLVFEIAIVRFVIQLAMTTPMLIYSNDTIIFSPKITCLLVFRGVTGTTGMLTRIYAVQNMPLGDATVLMFTTPVFVAILARIFLKEPLHKIYVFLIVLCLGGTTLIARPTFIFGQLDTSLEYKNIWIPSLVALISAVTTACSMIIIRVLGKHNIKSEILIFYFGLVGIIYSIIGSYVDKGFQFPFCQSIDYLYAICVGIFAVLVQTALNLALRFEKAFVVALSRTSGIVFGFVVQIAIFSLVPSILSFGGAALISLTNIIIFLFKWYNLKKIAK